MRKIWLIALCAFVALGIYACSKLSDDQSQLTELNQPTIAPLENTAPVPGNKVEQIESQTYFLTGEKAAGFLRENSVTPDDIDLCSDGSNDYTPIIADYPSWCFSLNVPWMSQMPPKNSSDSDERAWQLTNNCGQACCVMLGGYYNNGYVAPWVIDAENNWLGCSTPYGCGTGASTLQNLLTGFHHLRSEYHVGNEPDDVVLEGSRGRPVIVGVRTRMQSSGGRSHWMLFVGWDRTYMYFHDPGRSQPSGGRFVRYTVSQFRSSWRVEGRKYIPVYR